MSADVKWIGERIQTVETLLPMQEQPNKPTE